MTRSCGEPPGAPVQGPGIDSTSIKNQYLPYLIKINICLQANFVNIVSDDTLYNYQKSSFWRKIQKQL